MNAGRFGILVSRSLGLLFFVVGAGLLWHAIPDSTSTAWAFYPAGEAPRIPEGFRAVLLSYLPFILLMLAGVALWLFSRPLSRRFTPRRTA